MLILSRRKGERINIGDDIVVEIIEVKGRQVRLGIDAPRATRIHREEVYERIREENFRASETHLEDLERADALLGPQSRGRGRLVYGDRDHQIRDH